MVQAACYDFADREQCQRIKKKKKKTDQLHEFGLPLFYCMGIDPAMFPVVMHYSRKNKLRQAVKIYPHESGTCHHRTITPASTGDQKER